MGGAIGRAILHGGPIAPLDAPPPPPRAVGRSRRIGTPVALLRARLARRLRSAATAHVARRFNTWGLTDASQDRHAFWQSPPPVELERPLLFDANFNPKPAYAAVREVLSAKR